MQQRNFDQAAGSFPKAPDVGAAMAEYISLVGANAGRSTYGPAAEAGLVLVELRETLCRMFGHAEPETCILTSGATFGLNMALLGYLNSGDRVVTSSMEHNAVMRPLNELTKRGVTVERIPCCHDGCMDISELEARLTDDTRLIVMTHASNVCGTLLPIKEIGALAQDRGIPLVVDAAQTAGHIPIDMKDLGASALIVPAHKGLLGPSGIGAALLSREFASKLSPLTFGGTGSASDSEEQPRFLPDKFEAGTLNLPGAYGFLAALRYIESIGLDSVRRHEQELYTRFISHLRDIGGVSVFGTGDAETSVGVISASFHNIDNAEASLILEKEFRILTRCGLHCAPSAHRTLGTFPTGTVRFSFGVFNTIDDIDAAAEAIKEIAVR